MRHRRGRHHIGGARPDRAGGDHDLPAHPRLGESHRRKRHRLLGLLAAPSGQPILGRFERLGKTSDVAVAEDREHPGEQGLGTSIDLGLLGAKIADQCLGHGQAQRFHPDLLLGCVP